MIPSLRIALALAAVVATTATLAAPDARATREIDRLLAFVAASDCRFVRAGTAHDAREARDHLMRKFEFARSRIDTADQFVDRIATGSSLTGEAYKVRCGARELSSNAWLRAELERLRKSDSAR